jgi:hypothetical protein
MSIGPFATEREAGAAARSIGGPLREGHVILSEEQNRALLIASCKAAGVELGTYDLRILGWLAGFEDSTCGVIAGLIGRAYEGAHAKHEQD